MKKGTLYLLLALAVLLAASGLMAQDTPPPAPAAAAPVDEAAHAKLVVAKLGEKVVTVGEIEQELSRIPPQFASNFADPKRKEQYIQNMIDRQVFAKEAKAQGFLDKPDVKEKIDSYIERVLYSDFIKSLSDKITITPEETKAYYESNKASFAAPEKIKAKHILVKTEEEAKQVKDELDKGGNWDELAKKYSTDKSNASRGGDLGLFPRGRMVPEFDEVAFSLPLNQISSPVKTQFGYHLIKVEEKRPAELQTLEQVEKSVVGKLQNEKREKIVEQLRKELYAKFQVTLDTDMIKEIRVGTTSAAPTGPGSRAPRTIPLGRPVTGTKEPPKGEEPPK